MRPPEIAAKPDSNFKACFGATCRDLLVDGARRRRTEKRGGGRLQPLSSSMPLEARKVIDALELDVALAELASHDPVLARLAELRLFRELTIAECAKGLAMPSRTVDRKWAFVRSWLSSRMG